MSSCNAPLFMYAHHFPKSAVSKRRPSKTGQQKAGEYSARPPSVALIGFCPFSYAASLSAIRCRPTVSLCIFSCSRKILCASAIFGFIPCVGPLYCTVLPAHLRYDYDLNRWEIQVQNDQVQINI